eukprot:CAMPEP_0204375602 /NCGR_PEP_ID=MMETSP0469-20131031/49374_1 /ASSEMBLY_ACC=CAM_ASM_000384 /TAXON_ID=2969 /ORGANISM="Oxyrrhis marina" /LENGTH=189 /DNA_ID=CAMNT_0051366321 /DNA_START=7 /DNA_END=572 /DNA_ORIENTATION=+
MRIAAFLCVTAAAAPADCGPDGCRAGSFASSSGSQPAKKETDSGRKFFGDVVDEEGYDVLMRAYARSSMFAKEGRIASQSDQAALDEEVQMVDQASRESEIVAEEVEGEVVEEASDMVDVAPHQQSSLVEQDPGEESTTVATTTTTGVVLVGEGEAVLGFSPNTEDRCGMRETKEQCNARLRSVALNAA